MIQEIEGGRLLVGNILNASKIKINDVYTDEWGIKPKGRFEIPTAEEDTESIEIRGRHGSLTKKYGYKDIVFPITFTMHGISFSRIFRTAKMNLIYGRTLISDDDPTVYYKIKKVDIEPAGNIMKTFGEFMVNFTLAPFAYEIDNPVQTITSQTTVANLGYESEPIMTVHCSGAGKFYINDQVVTIENINGTITIDSEMQNAYRIANGSTQNLNNHMVGDFPVLEHGSNVIRFDGNISEVELIKNWRWV